MKKLSFLVVLCVILGCNQTRTKDQKELAQKTTEEILPLKITLRGQLWQIEDVGVAYPPMHFVIDPNKVDFTVGAAEHYATNYENTDLDQIFSMFELNDFKSNDHYFNPIVTGMDFMEIEKEIDGSTYVQNISSFKRGDIEVVYLDLDESSQRKFSVLSKYLNDIAVSILQDNADKKSMITAYSMSEAMTDPENVYELNFRNQIVTSLPSEIGALVNLRVLNISGSKISAIPSEIENCKQLRSIIANASSLSEIPASIGNLKKLRNINFGYCKIRELPEEFGNLESLWSLSLGDNQLQELPESIVNLKNVMRFSIAGNNFDEFPKEVLGLESVSNLWMHGNNFKSVPKEISDLKNMSHFLVDAHEIENIEEIKKLMPDVRIIDEGIRK